MVSGVAIATSGLSDDSAVATYTSQSLLEIASSVLMFPSDSKYNCRYKNDDALLC